MVDRGPCGGGIELPKGGGRCSARLGDGAVYVDGEAREAELFHLLVEEFADEDDRRAEGVLRELLGPINPKPKINGHSCRA